MATRVDMTTLAEDLAEILENVRRTGEQYDIERNGEVIASITPTSKPKRPTLRDLAQVLEGWPDDSFADDLDEIHRSQPLMPGDPWES